MAERRWTDHAIVQLTVVRFKEFLREPEALFWVFIFPVLLAAGLGIAFKNRPASVLKVAAVSPNLAHALSADHLLAVSEMSAENGMRALRDGRVALLAEPGKNGVVFHYDDTNPEGRTARMLADRAVQVAAGRTDPVASSDALLREPGSRYIDFLIPGLIAMNLMGSAIWGIGFAIVDARRRKLIKRIIVTPMPRSSYLASFVFSRLGLLVIEVGALLAFGVLAFHVPVRASLFTVLTICVLGSLAFCALALLIASRASTIEAASGLMNTAMMPMWILSGVFFSSQRFPDVVQPFIKALPLTAIVDALRAAMLQGSELWQLGPQPAVMSAWLVVCFILALRLFRWR